MAINYLLLQGMDMAVLIWSGAGLLFQEKVACQNLPNQISTHLPWFYARRNIEFISNDSG